jgi:hypothetical protein
MSIKQKGGATIESIDTQYVFFVIYNKRTDTILYFIGEESNAIKKLLEEGNPTNHTLSHLEINFIYDNNPINGDNILYAINGYGDTTQHLDAIHASMRNNKDTITKLHKTRPAAVRSPQAAVAVRSVEIPRELIYDYFKPYNITRYYGLPNRSPKYYCYFNSMMQLFKYAPFKPTLPLPIKNLFDFMKQNNNNSSNLHTIQQLQLKALIYIHTKWTGKSGFIRTQTESNTLNNFQELEEMYNFLLEHLNQVSSPILDDVNQSILQHLDETSTFPDVLFIKGGTQNEPSNIITIMGTNYVLHGLIYLNSKCNGGERNSGHDGANHFIAIVRERDGFVEYDDQNVSIIGPEIKIDTTMANFVLPNLLRNMYDTQYEINGVKKIIGTIGNNTDCGAIALLYVKQ